MDKTELMKKLEEKEKYLEVVRGEMIAITGQVALLRELLKEENTPPEKKSVKGKDAK